MWMPGYKESEFDWRKSKADMMAAFGKAEKTPDQIKADQAARADFSDRRRQALEAQARGASREEIKALMEV